MPSHGCAQAKATAGICRAHGIIFTYSGGVRGVGETNPRAETAGVGFFDRMSLVEIVEVIGDKPTDAILPGRAIFTVIRYISDPTVVTPRLLLYMPQPSLPNDQIADAWRRVNAWVCSWYATAHRYLRKLMIIGDLNAEPPDVVRARSRPNNVRKTAEGLLRALIEANDLRVASGSHPTHFQDTTALGASTQQRKRRKNARTARDAHAVDQDDPSQS